jgi:[acyl-carrier-protein] S-malonyltransferase
MPLIAFLFPGQGSQYLGMGHELAQKIPAARALFDEARLILGYDLLEVCRTGPAEKLNATVISQPAIFVTSLAALESLRERDPDAVSQCRAVAGLSLGEYTALTFAGALSFQDGLQVVQRRGEAMQSAADATPGGMVSILGLDQVKVEEICRAARGAGTLEIANLLCPGNTVISGSKAACEAGERLATEMGGRTIRLTVAGAFHTELMKPGDQALARALSGLPLRVPSVPVWFNVDAQPHTHPEEIRSLLVRQVLQPVLWEQSLRNLLAFGCDRFFEIGPGRVLTGLLKRVQRKIDCQNIAG